MAALSFHRVIGSGAGPPVGHMLTLSVVASLVGLVSTRAYYLLPDRDGRYVGPGVVAAIPIFVPGSWVGGSLSGHARRRGPRPAAERISLSWPREGRHSRWSSRGTSNTVNCEFSGTALRSRS